MKGAKKSWDILQALGFCSSGFPEWQNWKFLDVIYLSGSPYWPGCTVIRSLRCLGPAGGRWEE
jgi:hypothetical protein